MAASHRRHDISDRVWKILEPSYLAARARWAGLPKACPVLRHGDNRRFLNAVKRRVLDPAHRAPWRDRGVWDRLLDVLIDDPDFEWLLIDASHIKVHLHAAGAVGGNQAIARTKGAEQQAPSGGGRSRDAGADDAYRGNGGGLHLSIAVD